MQYAARHPPPFLSIMMKRSRKLLIALWLVFSAFGFLASALGLPVGGHGRLTLCLRFVSQSAFLHGAKPMQPSVESRRGRRLRYADWYRHWVCSTTSFASCRYVKPVLQA